MKVITFKTQNKPFGILTLAGDWTGSAEEAVYKCVKDPAEFKEIENLIIDNTFFNAYEFDSVLGAKINTTKAKEVWKNKFRIARKPILEKLDIEYMKAIENNNTQKQEEIAAQKQALRDVTDISLPDDLEDLKNTWPDILNS